MKCLSAPTVLAPFDNDPDNARKVAFLVYYPAGSTLNAVYRTCKWIRSGDRSTCTNFKRLHLFERTLHRRSRRRSFGAPPPACCAGAGQDAISTGLADNFDRDYFDELKREYASDKVRIYGKDDYNLDESATSWLSEYRGVDVSEIVRKSAARPTPDDMHFPPLHLTDLHDEDEVDTFVTRAQEYDPVSGRVWTDPPPDMHLVEEREFSDFRYDPDDECEDMENEHPEPEDLAFVPLRRTPRTEEEEIAALRESCARLEQDEISQRAHYVRWHDQFLNPGADEFAKWTEAAQKRGGNSTENNSFCLAPVSPAAEGSDAAGDSTMNVMVADVPEQFSCLARLHAGRWRGSVDVVSLFWEDGNVQVAEHCSASIESLVGIFTNLSSLTWESTVSRKLSTDEIHTSALQFASTDGGESLSPERAVFESGAFISQRQEEGTFQSPPCLSLSNKCISFLTDTKVNGIIELCVISGAGDDVRRSRFILCARDNDGDVATKRPKKGKSTKTFSHVIAIYETRLSAPVNSQPFSFSPHLLYGRWHGTGISLHPFYPPVPAVRLTSEQRCWTASNVQPTEVSWTEEDFSSMRDESKQFSVYASGSKNQKRSKRVSAAAKHDIRRLAPCTMLVSDRVGDSSETRHAWRWNEGDYITAYSPRIGKFVGDYFSIVLPGAFLLTAPAGPARPSMHNDVSVTEICSPKRTRLIAGRSATGTLVGAVLLTETIEE